MTDATSDKKQIGLTETGDSALASLMETGWFAAESDAYKSAIAYALAKNLKLEEQRRRGVIRQI